MNQKQQRRKQINIIRDNDIANDILDETQLYYHSNWPSEERGSSERNSKKKRRSKWAD